MYEYVRAGYWLVLPYSALRGHPLLKIAPAGVVPQRERRPRPIMDYSYNHVNKHSLDIAPTRTMQFGFCLQRLLQHLAYSNPAFGPPLMAKLNLADVYYRVPLSSTAALELAVILPADGSSEPLLGIPLSLPMGWTHSPPHFCSFTETCADLANNCPVTFPSHQFALVTAAQPMQQLDRTFADTVTWPYNPTPPPTPLSLVDVYLDDFMVIAQAPQHAATLETLLHHLNTVFYDAEHSPRKSVVLQSKIDKGDATLSTQKRIHGWDVNTESMTIHLPSHRAERLRDLLHTFSQKRYASRRKWQSLLGELRSMAIAIHSAQYLFCILQHGLPSTNTWRFRLSSLVKRALHNWQDLVTTLHQRPVPITMLVPHAPHYWANVDASARGMGGLWLPTNLTADKQLYVWRQKFPPNVTARLTSFTNPCGDITNSELELAELVVGHHTQQSHIPCQYTNTTIATDNTPTQAWVAKGSTTSAGPPAFLLRLLAQDFRAAGAHVTPVYTPGNTNTIAAFLSRSFHLDDADLLSSVQRHFPIQPPWKLATPPTSILSATNWAPSRQLPPWEYRLAEPRRQTPAGASGRNFACPWHATRSLLASTTRSPSYKYLLANIEWELLLPPSLQSKLAWWKEPYVPWARLWPHWGS
jgi:hypothetical protein